MGICGLWNQDRSAKYKHEGGPFKSLMQVSPITAHYRTTQTFVFKRVHEVLGLVISSANKLFRAKKRTISNEGLHTQLAFGKLRILKARNIETTLTYEGLPLTQGAIIVLKLSRITMEAL